MLIAISGSQGSGKSTVIAHLDYSIVTRKTSRSILADWNVSLSQVNNDRELTVKFQEEILKRKLMDDSVGLNTPDVYITERTPIDLATYAIVALGKDNEYSEWLDDYCGRCIVATIEYYMHTFYLTAGHFQPVNDGVRAVNQFYSRMVDLTMQDLYRRSVSVDFIDFADLKARVDFIDRTIDNKN